MNPILQFILGVVQANLNVLQSVLQKLGLVATEKTANDIYTIVNQNQVMLLDIRAQQDNATAALDAFRAEAESNSLAIISAISGLPAVGSPVTLPTVPPVGYGYVGDSAIFNAVWNGLNAPDVNTPYDFLRPSGVWAQFLLGYLGYFPSDGYFAMISPIPNEFGVIPSFYPAFNTAAIGAGDTLLSFLTSQNPTASVFETNGPGSTVGVAGNTGDGVIRFNTLQGEEWFQRLKAGLGFGAAVVAPSVWPGVASVILGSSVALGRTVTLTELMDGVIITLTAVPPGKPTYVLGALTATAHIGQVAFVADNGAAEYPQNLSFASEIYVPTALASAAAVVLRTVPGVTGTVQAWKRRS